MSNEWMRRALALGILTSVALAVGCGGDRQQEALSTAEAANTQSASLRIEGMT